MKRKLLSICLAAGLIIGTASSVSAAVNLKDSFSAGRSIYPSDYKFVTNETKYTKEAWARTNGYCGLHYVRAYIGGTASSVDGACADSGRIWSYGDIQATCAKSQWNSRWFPTAYGKYGTGK